MKKATILIIALVLLLALAACGGSGNTAADTDSAAAQATPQPASSSSDAQTAASDGTPQPPAANGTPGMPFQGEMPDSMKLAYGIFQLEESEVPIDAAQAAQLLPLWKAARSLSKSDTAATAEIEALFKQIRNTLTAEQQQVIDSAEFNPQDFAALGEKYGLTFGFGPGGGQMDESTRATVEALRASGQMPERGQGGGPGFGPGGGEGGIIVGGQGAPGDGFAAGGDPAAMQTAVAENGGTRGARLGLNSALLDAIITFLEGKVQ
jgi:hypothetical protein